MNRDSFDGLDNFNIHLCLFLLMPYNETDSLKDQVGILVGLFASEERIAKLSQIQLAQMGPKITPYLLSVLGDMLERRIRVDEKIKKIEDEDRKDQEDRGYERYTPSYGFEQDRDKLIVESMFKKDIVNNTLEVLSYFSDNSLSDTFAEWIPYLSAVKGLVRIGTQKSFILALRTIYDMYKVQTETEQKFGENSGTISDSDIAHQLFKWGVPEISNYDRSYTAQLDDLRLKLLKEVISYVPTDILKDHILEFPKLEPHQKEFHKDLMEKIGYKEFRENILDWYKNGDFDTRMILSNGLMECKDLIKSDVAPMMFSLVLEGLEADRSYEWLTEETPEKVDEFLVDVTDTKGRVEMYFKILAAKEKYVNENGDEVVYRPELSYSDPETWDDLPIVGYIQLKLQEHREDAINVLSKYLTNKDKKLVRWSTQLLGKLTEEAE